ncbi:MAG: hypothetical protein AAGJ73_14865 [Pseudomonadota bacterium]
MRATLIIVVDPVSDQMASMADAVKEVSVETFVAGTPVERDAECILRRPSEGDVLPVSWPDRRHVAIAALTQESTRRDCLR